MHYGVTLPIGRAFLNPCMLQRTQALHTTSKIRFSSNGAPQLPKVLVVEDDPNILKFFTTYHTSNAANQYAMATVRNTQEFKALQHPTSFDVYIIDKDLSQAGDPFKDGGLRIIEFLLQNGVDQNRIILSSNNTNDPDIVMFLRNYPVVAHIQKMQVGGPTLVDANHPIHTGAIQRIQTLPLLPPNP